MSDTKPDLHTAAMPAPRLETPDRNGVAPDLARASSTGTWGEEQRGEAVDVQRAREEFTEIARHPPHRPAHPHRRPSQPQQQRSTGVASRLARTLSRATAEESSDAHADADDVERQQEAAGGDPDFDLSTWIQTRMAQEEAEGKSSHKPLGVAWRDVDVSVPGGAAGGALVKTLPIAIANTATRDPWSILCYLVPPLRKVGFSRAQPTATKLVRGHTGLVRAGEMCLVLGAPASGCTTLLKALTASSDSNLRVDGHINFSGLSTQEVQRRYRGEVVFCSEDDLHFSTLTVEQTLRFALTAKVPTRSQRLESEGRSDFINLAIDTLLKIFNMEHTRKTIVGDAATRGVSGGERKRVTISEALITRAAVQAHDNSTRGLDASTALEYTRSLRVMTDLSHRATFATLYQVSENIFNLFDKVAVLDKDGRLVYFGPRSEARSYFESLGYMPESKRETTADFVVACCEPTQAHYRPGWEKAAPKTPEEREAAWRSSDHYRRLAEEVAAFEQECAESDARDAKRLQAVVAAEKNSGVSHKSPFTVSYWEQVKACIWRQLLIKLGARDELYTKNFTIIGVSLLIGAMFYGTTNDSNGAFLRGGVILFACLFVGWLQLSETFDAVSGRPILARQRTFALVRPSAVVIARAIIDVPLLLVQTFATSIILYFLSRLRVDAGAFFIFWAYVFLSAYSVTALYRVIAAFSPTFQHSLRLAVLALNVLVAATGYIVRLPQLKRLWLIFLYYISPTSYAFSALMANEFNYNLPCAPGSVVPFGTIRDERYQTCSLTGATPGQTTVRGVDYLSATFNYSRRVIAYNWAVIIAFSVLYLIPTVIAAEIFSYGGAGGGVTFYARTKEARRKLKGEAAEAEKDRPAAEAPAQAEAPPSPPSAPVAAPGEDSDSTRANSESSSAAVASKVKAAADPASKAVFTWRDVNLTLPTGRRLLQHVDGWCKPGELTALMGASGAGKTTLMTTLAQRGGAGIVTGDVLVDGKPLDRAFQKGTAFVLQADVHVATSTVWEAVSFSALLRRPASVPREEKLAYARSILELLELVPIRDALVGEPGAGLSVEQRKRVSIAVELAAKPELLLFLDEPTSGLDSEGAGNIIRLLRRLAHEQGQAVLCVIHQPSSQLFESFDRVLLLTSGGRTTYFGPVGKDSCDVVNYFEGQGASHIVDGANAAEWMLEVVSGGRRNVDWGKKWAESAEAAAVRAEIDAMNRERAPRPALIDPAEVTEYSASFREQTRELILRDARDMWREPSFAYAVFFSFLCVGFLSGGFLYSLGSSPVYLQQLVFLGLLVLLNSPSLVNSILSSFTTLRSVAETREFGSRTYSWQAFLTAFLVTTFPLAVIGALLFAPPSLYLALGKTSANVAGSYIVNVFTINLYFIEFSLLLVAGTTSVVAASNMLPFLLTLLFIGNGLVVPQGSLPQPFKTALYYANPVTWYVKSAVSVLLHNRAVVCDEVDINRFNPPPGQTCDAYAGAWARSSPGYLVNPGDMTNCGYCPYRTGDDFAATLKIDYGFRWQAFGIMWGYIVGNIALVFGLYWLVQVHGVSVAGPVRRLGKLLRRQRPQPQPQPTTEKPAAAVEEA